MRIIPAIDIKDGKCTQLIGGMPGTETFYGDPVFVAKKWESLGSEILHVIDLDSTLGSGNNTEKLLEIKNSVNIPIQFGGGIRTIGAAREFLEYGIERIILGTLAISDYLNNFEIINELRDEFGPDRIIVALDSKKGNIVVKGWQEKTELKAHEFVRNFEGLIWGFLYTDVDVEGKMMGINLKRTKRVVESTHLPVIVSGGISSAGDIEDLKEISTWGVVLGKALYEGKIDFEFINNNYK